MQLPTNGFWNFLQRIFGEISETARKETKSFVILVEFIAIVTLSALLVFSDQKTEKINEVRISDKEAIIVQQKKLIQKMMFILVPKLEKKVEKEVKKQNEEVIQELEKSTETLEELTKVIKNEKK